jgi:hypothetical protein
VHFLPALAQKVIETLPLVATAVLWHLLHEAYQRDARDV